MRVDVKMVSRWKLRHVAALMAQATTMSTLSVPPWIMIAVNQCGLDQALEKCKLAQPANQDAEVHSPRHCQRRAFGERHAAEALR